MLLNKMLLNKMLLKQNVAKTKHCPDPKIIKSKLFLEQNKLEHKSFEQNFQPFNLGAG